MFLRSRGDNLRSVFVLLFLNVAFYFLEHQDPKRFARLFAFEWSSVRSGEVWRLFTYQFTQAGTGIMETLALFITLLLLYMMGTAIEEEWGTRHFLTLFVLSSLGSAGVAAAAGIPLLGSYFVFFTLLFIYAAAFPQQTFYLFGAMPVRVRVLAMISLAVLLYGVFSGGIANLAALVGAGVAYSYYSIAQRVRVRFVVQAIAAAEAEPAKIDMTVMQNVARHAAIKHVVTDAEIDRLIVQCEREIVPGVNICPPADYKPENVDGYCLRCEGFAECSARHLRMNRTRIAPAALVAKPDVP